MAGVKFEVQADMSQFLAMRKIAKQFPEIRAQMLGYVGSRGKHLLFDNFLSGQELTYKNSDMRDSHGRNTVNYKITKRALAVKIRSYPANFFEKGRKLRSGNIEPGKYIITRKFKSLMASQLQGILNEFDTIYLQRKLDRAS